MSESGGEIENGQKQRVMRQGMEIAKKDVAKMAKADANRCDTPEGVEMHGCDAVGAAETLGGLRACGFGHAPVGSVIKTDMANKQSVERGFKRSCENC